MYVRITRGVMLLLTAIMAVGCKVPGHQHGSGIPVSHNLPPAQMLMEPGPGVGGPGPGVLAAGPLGPGGGMMAGGMMGGGGAPMMGGGYGVAPAGCVGCADGGGGPGYAGLPPQVASSNVQIKFDRPVGMQVQWDVAQPGAYDSSPLVVPGRQNFAQGGVFRLKLSNIEGRQGVELYPTLEVGPVTARTAAYLAHSAVPIQFTEEDFDQVAVGNFVTKVIYVPDPEFQELAFAGIDTLVSTRLDPGVDPIVEADRRGSILAIVRMGNKDMQVPGSDAGLGMEGTIPAAGGTASGQIATGYISGVSGPTYGMPWVGTPIGLPGPPHIPLGGPAGLQQYSIQNHTQQMLPGPTSNVSVHVKQKPGLSYPAPANKVLIQETTLHPEHFNNQPPANMIQGDIPPTGCEFCGGQGCRHCK